MSNPQIRVNAMSFAKLVAALNRTDCSKPELAEITGLHIWTVRHYVDALHKESVVHITRWGKDSMGRDVTAFYRLGMGLDMPREVKTAAQKMRTRRERQRAAALADQRLT